MSAPKKWSHRGYDVSMRKSGSHYVAVISRDGKFVDQMTSVGPESHAVAQFRRFIDAVAAGPAIGVGARVRIVGDKYPHLAGKVGVVTPIRGAVYGGSYGYPVTIDGQFYTIDSDSIEPAGGWYSVKPEIGAVSAGAQESATMSGMHAAQDYVAVDSRGKKVAGPFRDYGEARLHADRAGGYVTWASDLGANDCVGVHTHGQPGPAVVVAGEGGYINWVKEADGWFGSPIGYGPRGSQWFFKIFDDAGTFRLQVFDGAVSIAEPIKIVVVRGPLSEAKARAQQELLAGLRHEMNESGAAESGHRCTVESATKIAQQIPGSPYEYRGTYPPGAPARVERVSSQSVSTPEGQKTIEVKHCGKHIILQCPVSGDQFLFERACIADVKPEKAQRGRVPAAPGIDAEKGKPFVLRVRKGRTVTTEKGPFALITDAVDAMQALGAPGETATIYDGGKVASYRGGKAVFSFGRTRWSRA
jgi:hypothetical protein